jgi:hypothetical protein
VAPERLEHAPDRPVARDRIRLRDDAATVECAGSVGTQHAARAQRRIGAVLHVVQGASGSPRNSIITKRPFDRRMPRGRR